MNRDKFARDLLVLLASIVILASFSFVGKIHWTMSLAFLVLYAWYGLLSNKFEASLDT